MQQESRPNAHARRSARSIADDGSDCRVAALNDGAFALTITPGMQRCMPATDASV